MPTGFTLIYHAHLGEWHLNLCWGATWLTERKWRRIPISDEEARRLMTEIDDALARQTD